MACLAYLRQAARLSGACFGREPARLHGGAEGSMVPFGLVGVGLGEVGDRPIETLALAEGARDLHAVA